MGILIFGALVLLTLFWSVGAHNRLVRLRSEVIRQWSSVDAVWLRLLVRLQGGLAARESLSTETDLKELELLQAACDGLLEALSQMRLQPLVQTHQKQVISQHLKLVGEIRLLQQTAHAPIQPDLEIALNRMRQTLPAALIPYHVAVVAYNDALAMQPAAWLGRRLGLQPATKMDLSVGVS